jgi:ATP-dependent RNA helicase HelY
VMQGEFPISKILFELQGDDLLPAILFRTSRRQCDLDVEKVADYGRLQVTAAHQRLVEEAVHEVVKRYSMEPEVIFNHPQYKSLVKAAVGAHHAGQLLVWRLVLEELMSKGLLRILVATGTVAAGVDFPARTVIVTAHSKRGTEGFKVLTSSEFQQMSGRAGRRGKDAVGICLMAPGPYCDARVLHEVAQRPPEPLRSAYFAAPSTVLNLLKHRNVDDLRYTVSKSLAAFLDRRNAEGLRHKAEEEEKRVAGAELTGERLKKAEKRVRRELREAEQLEMRQQLGLETSLNGLERLGHVENGSLTEKGLWAAELCTSLVLELAEAIADHIFTDLTEEELVGLVASIAGDSYRTYFSLKRNPINPEYYKKLEAAVARVKDSYLGSQFASEVVVQPSASVTVLTWMEAENWGEYSALLRLAGVAEGDAARLITQTADHLQQISRLAETHTELARRAGDARRILLRPPVTDSYGA